MPWRQKKKVRASENRHQAQEEPENLVAAQATRLNEAADQQVEEKTTSFKAPSTEPFHRGPLDKKPSLLVLSALQVSSQRARDQGRERKKCHTDVKELLPLIIMRASEHLELVFGHEGRGSLPAHLYPHEQRASLENIECDGVYWRRRHFILGEPEKLNAKGLVKEDYLEYHQVPDSDPPCFEFLWSPRAHTETRRMKVLELCAKVHDTGPTAFPFLYEKAVRDEEARA
ncbi:melanoma-associated antigen B10-like [Saccopteryx leptura]|uniref:melanoma-associated antigen B10-like n=1 Tax=Saccopteryx leptura TaxID=249018 RepID=UPI00339CD605